MESLFDRIDSLRAKYCFQGHTHIPGVFNSAGDFVSPEECDYSYELTGDRVMVNVGSVGQPRDGDNRACYVVLDENQINFRRVDYPFNETIQKIYDIPDLDNMLGDRLRDGR